jgi:hypothetical protein
MFRLFILLLILLFLVVAAFLGVLWRLGSKLK